LKVYISVDLEGISGIVYSDETNPWRGLDYEKARKRITADVNSAVKGALKGGAEEIVVRDAHGGVAPNILWEELHSEAKLIRAGPAKLWPLVDGLDSSYDAVFLIGYHARAGTPGVLSHTYIGPFLDVKLNGESAGEAKFAAYLSGYIGVPIVLVSGDDVTCEDAKSWLPGVSVAVVKEALDRYGAKLLSAEKAHKLIQKRAEESLKLVNKIEPYEFSVPVKLEVTCKELSTASRLALIPGVTYDDYLTVTFTSGDLLEVNKAFISMQMCAGTRLGQILTRRRQI
jgi:D-amino peptidase